MWFLHATVEVDEPELIDPGGFLGVDRGIANIAYGSDGTRYDGTKLNGYRRRQARRGRCPRRSRCGLNIAARGVEGWGAVNRPHAA